MSESHKSINPVWRFAKAFNGSYVDVHHLVTEFKNGILTKFNQQSFVVSVHFYHLNQVSRVKVI